MSSPAMYFPSDFDMDTARLCGQLSDDAYDMYSQKKDSVIKVVMEV